MQGIREDAMLKKGFRSTIGIIFVLLFSSSAGMAQSPTAVSMIGSAAGHVVKADNGKPILGARVGFLIPTTGWTASKMTGKDGKFTFTGLSPVVYLVTVTAPGYKELQLAVKINEKSGPLLLKLQRVEQETKPQSDSVVSVQELQVCCEAKSAFA
jgi:Carboxypeptidase regulatory-like domain